MRKSEYMVRIVAAGSLDSNALIEKVKATGTYDLVELDTFKHLPEPRKGKQEVPSAQVTEPAAVAATAATGAPVTGKKKVAEATS